MNNIQKTIRLPYDINKLRFNILRGLNSLDELRKFFSDNEINNPEIWNLINNVEQQLRRDSRE